MGSFSAPFSHSWTLSFSFISHAPRYIEWIQFCILAAILKTIQATLIEKQENALINSPELNTIQTMNIKRD